MREQSQHNGICCSSVPPLYQILMRGQSEGKRHALCHAYYHWTVAFALSKPGMLPAFPGPRVCFPAVCGMLSVQRPTPSITLYVV
jgi:hypothetical protein